MPHHGKELKSNVIELYYWYILLCLEARPINKSYATCLVTVFRSERHVYMIESLTVQYSRKSQSTFAGFRDRVAALEYSLQHRIIDFCHELLTQFSTQQSKLLYPVTKLANCEPKLLLTFLDPTRPRYIIGIIACIWLTLSPFCWVGVGRTETETKSQSPPEYLITWHSKSWPGLLMIKRVCLASVLVDAVSCFKSKQRWDI